MSGLSLMPFLKVQFSVLYKKDQLQLPFLLFFVLAYYVVIVDFLDAISLIAKFASYSLGLECARCSILHKRIHSLG